MPQDKKGTNTHPDADIDLPRGAKESHQQLFGKGAKIGEYGASSYRFGDSPDERAWDSRPVRTGGKFDTMLTTEKKPVAKPVAKKAATRRATR